jgi:hypothetical protein
MNEIYPNFEEPKFEHQLTFEIKSWIGRHLIKHKSKVIPTNSPLLLDRCWRKLQRWLDTYRLL